MEIAMRNSFALQAVFVDDEPSSSDSVQTIDSNDRSDNQPSTSAPDAGAYEQPSAPTPATSGKKLVGFARLVSDGQFAALVVDLAVHPDYQRRGIGRKLMNRLIATSRRMGPETVAAFPRPKERLFFWKMQFRYVRDKPTLIACHIKRYLQFML